MEINPQVGQIKYSVIIFCEIILLVLSKLKILNIKKIEVLSKINESDYV